MRYAGIDVAAERHAVAVVDEREQVLQRPALFGEDAEGYARVREVLGPAERLVVALEATGHYWQNLVATLLADGYAVALLNPLRTRRFAEEDLARAKTDEIDALVIARMAAQKRIQPTALPDAVAQQIREAVRLRERIRQEMGDKVRQLHRLVDLGFPEFSRHVKRLDTMLATAILREYPTAEAFRRVSKGKVARLCYDGRHKVGDELAHALVDAAKVSVGQHHAPVYRVQVGYLCDDLDTLRRRLKELDRDIGRMLEAHEVGRLLTTIDGIGDTAAANLVAELGDLSRFPDASAVACYVGVIPGTKQSGKHRPLRSPLCPLGNARLRKALWMPTLAAVQRNPWLRAYYQGLRARGKPAKVALVAAMRKLLHAAFSVAKNRRPFTPLLPPAPLPPRA